MLFTPELLDYIEAQPESAWSGEVYRHMFGEYPPTIENTFGARWNPRDVPAIYASLDASTARAEGDHQIAVQPIRPRATRSIYTLRVDLRRVVDLSVSGALELAGVGAIELNADDHGPCQAVGGAVAWLGRDGLLVPSARATGVNFVIYTARLDPDAEIEVIGREQIST